VTTPSYQPPPDTSGYVDLRIFDRTDQEIIDAALALAKINLPEWTPLEGHTEVLLIEALALEMAEAIVAINRLPGAVLETLLRFANVSRDFGAAPTAQATITVADLAGHDIPAGTRLFAPTADGIGIVTLLVRPPGLAIPAGSRTGTIAVIGDTFTDAANGVPAGTQLSMTSPLPFVESVVLATPIADGRSAETDDAWRDRGVQRLSRLSETLVLPRHFEAAALEDPNVARVVVVDNNDPGTTGSGDDPGHVTVAVLGEGGALLSAGAKSALQDTLTAQSHVALAVHVVDVAIVTVTATIAVHLSSAADPEAVTQAAETAVIDYLDPLTWNYGTTLRRNELISLVDQVVGVDYVDSVTITGANAAGNLPMPTPSTVPTATAASITVSIV
jgi:uncharacterized phage protein gp47/JayE